MPIDISGICPITVNTHPCSLADHQLNAEILAILKDWACSFGSSSGAVAWEYFDGVNTDNVTMTASVSANQILSVHVDNIMTYPEPVPAGITRSWSKVGDVVTFGFTPNPLAFVAIAYLT